MVGIQVRYYCPKCDCDRETDLGCTPYINYKGKRLAVLYCHYCGTKLACETENVRDNQSMHTYNDETGLGILSSLDKFFNEKGYNDETSEETIETEMWNFAVEKFGDVARWNEYDIKSYIQKLMSQLNRGSSKLFSITFNDLYEESKKAGKCVYTSAGAVCY